MIPSLIPIFGYFPAGGVTLDEDDHESVCTVCGVLTLPGEEERRKEPFDSVTLNPIFTFLATKSGRRGQYRKKISCR